MNILPGVSPRHVLRAGTRVAHAEVDALFGGGLASLRDYRIYLAGMHAFVVVCERALQARPDWTRPPFPLTRHIASLRADLLILSNRPLAEPLPVLVVESDEQAAGTLYVIEGSAIGARVLLRDAQRLGHVSLHGASFLYQHADGEDGRRWPRYLASLDAHGFDGQASLDALQQAANDAFAVAGICFSRAAANEQVAA